MTVTSEPAPSPLRRELLSLLACPEDGGPLFGWDGSAETGALSCESCGRTFPVQGGVPCLLPAELAPPAPNNGGGGGNAEAEEKRREMAARDEQAGDYDRMLGLRLFSVPEIPLTLRYLSLEPRHLMLEAGCGTGRMTAAFAERVRGMVCVDFSAASIAAARKKLTPELATKVIFAQADVCYLPLRADAFDRVGSFQVLEHLPTPEARAQAVADMARVLKGRTEGGRMALSAYRWGAPVSLLSQKQGHHAGGIPFFRSTWDELQALVVPHLAIGQHTGALLYHYLLWGRRHI